MSEKITTPIVRCVYPNLAAPKPADSEINANKYTLLVLVPKSETAWVEKCRGLIKAVATEKFKSKATNVKSPLKDGDEKLNDDGDVVEMYKDHWYFNLSSAKTPFIINGMKLPVSDSEKAAIKGGDYVRVQIGLAAYDNIGNKGVGSYLNIVQFVRPGASLGGSPNDISEFDVVEGAFELEDA